MALYNALIKSIPKKNHQDRVTGKVLLTNLHILPLKWTILFRGEYLSRKVNMEKLLCSPQDPIIIYKGIVKPPSSSFSVQIDCRTIPQFEENGKINLEVKPLDSVGNLGKRIAEQLGKPDEEITLIFNDKVLKNYESLQDCKIVKDGCQIDAKIKEDEPVELVDLTGDLPPGKKISETYRVCFGGNKAEDKEKLAFFNVRKDNTPHNVFKKRKGRGKQEKLKIERGIVIEAMMDDTVDILKGRICAVFQVDSEAHSIFKGGLCGEELEDDEMLEDRLFQEGKTIHIKGLKRSESDSDSDSESDSEEENEKSTRVKKIQPRNVTILTRAGVIAKAKADEKKRLEKEMETWSGKRKLEEKRGKKPKYRLFLNEKFHGCGPGGGMRRPSPPPPPPPRFRSFKAQDVDRNAIAMFGEEPTHDWNLYSFGMTLYGTCPNEECISRTTTVKNENGVSHIAGYGNIILTPKRFKFDCSACEEEMFPVKEFVLCGGRALFRFKKSGVGEVVKTVVIESEFYDLMKYKTFDNTTNSEEVQTCDYDFIEITTVKPWCGLYTCVRCDGRIRFKQDENVLRCGHAYHNECTAVNVGTDDDSDVGCEACNAGQLQSMYDMLGMESGNSSSEEALVEEL